MKFLLVCENHLTDWPLAYPASSGTASEVIALIKQRIIYLFEGLCLIISDNGPCFTASLLQKFPNKYSNNWKAAMAYAFMSNGGAE